MYGLGAFVLMLVALAAFAVLDFLPQRVTPGNIEAHLRKWADDYSLGVTKVSDEKNVFTLTVQVMDNSTIGVAREKSNDQTLWLGSRLVFSDSQQTALKEAGEERQIVLGSHLRQHLAALNISYSNVVPPFTNMSLGKRISINGLDEVTFFDKLHEVQDALIVARETIVGEVHTWPEFKEKSLFK